MSRRRGAKYDSPELEIGDDAVEVDAVDATEIEASESPVEVAVPAAPTVPPEAYEIEIDLGSAVIGAPGFFAMKRALRRLRREYITNLKAIKGRNVTVIMRVSGAPNT